MAADPENTLVIETTKGRVVIELRPDLAPKHVERIKQLAREGFYNGIAFHRVIDGFMAQTGCPKGTGTGGSSYPDLKAEFNAEPHVRGVCSMARSKARQRQQPVLHRLRRRQLPRQAVHGVGQGHRGHGQRRQDQARRAGARSRQDGFGEGRRRRVRRRDRGATCSSASDLCGPRRRCRRRPGGGGCARQRHAALTSPAYFLIMHATAAAAIIAAATRAEHPGRLPARRSRAACRRDAVLRRHRRAHAVDRAAVPHGGADRRLDDDHRLAAAVGGRHMGSVQSARLAAGAGGGAQHGDRLVAGRHPRRRADCAAGADQRTTGARPRHARRCGGGFLCRRIGGAGSSSRWCCRKRRGSRLPGASRRCGCSSPAAALAQSS